MNQIAISLLTVLDAKRILPAIRSTKKAAVIQELAANLSDEFTGLKQHEVEEVLLKREGQGSTAIGEGIAVPHAKLPSADRMIACLGRSHKGVDFGSADGGKTHLFFAIISPINSAGSHLRLLARFSQLFKSAEFRAKLMRAESAEDMYGLIVEQDSK